MKRFCIFSNQQMLCFSEYSIEFPKTDELIEVWSNVKLEAEIYNNLVFLCTFLVGSAVWNTCSCRLLSWRISVTFHG